MNISNHPTKRWIVEQVPSPLYESMHLGNALALVQSISCVHWWKIGMCHWMFSKCIHTFYNGKFRTFKWSLYSFDKLVLVNSVHWTQKHKWSCRPGVGAEIDDDARLWYAHWVNIHEYICCIFYALRCISAFAAVFDSFCFFFSKWSFFVIFQSLYFFEIFRTRWKTLVNNNVS